MKMHLLRNIIAAYLIGLVCLSVSFAQHRDHLRPPKGGSMPPEEFVKELKKKLNLTNEQEAKIQKIVDAQQEEMKKTFKASKKEHEARREEMEKERDAIREKMNKQRKETNENISSVLTEEQKKKFEEMQKEQPQRPPRRPDRDCFEDRPAGPRN
jgi:Spy/CpxP family protein refolding chaperone